MGEMTLEQVRQGEQDMRDGEALRLLREALPGHAPRFSFGNYVDEEARTVFYRVWHIRSFAGPDDRGTFAEGATIAEAADACRAALAPDGARVTAP